MRTLPAGMQAHLDAGTTTLAFCWKVTRKDGTVLGFTQHDRALSFDGVDYEPESGVTASEIEASLGLSVDNLDVAGLLKSDVITEDDIAAGYYDNADVEIWLVNWASIAQRLLIGAGNLGEVTRGEVGFTAELRGLAHRLQQSRGRLFQKYCDADLGDARCGIDLDDPSYMGTGTVAAVATDGSFNASGLDGFASHHFSRGRVLWLTGDNAGLQHEVRSHTNASSVVTVALWIPPFAAIEIGDTFEIRAGCDKTFATCKSKFSNAVNFRGFPTMPGNDFVAVYPKPGSASSDG